MKLDELIRYAQSVRKDVGNIEIEVKAGDLDVEIDAIGVDRKKFVIKVR